MYQVKERVYGKDHNGRPILVAAPGDELTDCEAAAMGLTAQKPQSDSEPSVPAPESKAADASPAPEAKAADKAPKAKDPAADAVPLERMNKTALLAVAAERKVSIAEGATKADIIAAINAG